jgi:hypothetical protein
VRGEARVAARRGGRSAPPASGGSASSLRVRWEHLSLAPNKSKAR